MNQDLCVLAASIILTKTVTDTEPFPRAVFGELSGNSENIEYLRVIREVREDEQDSDGSSEVWRKEDREPGLTANDAECLGGEKKTCLSSFLSLSFFLSLNI